MPSAVVRQWREISLSRLLQKYGTLAFFNSVKENKFFEKSRTLCNTISAQYHVTKPERLQMQTMHKADLFLFEGVILTGRGIVIRNY
jgi:hypothetical protein